jgi:hypothetical protein
MATLIGGGPVGFVVRWVTTMKSFRLDRESVNDFVASWPIMFIAVAVASLFGYFGWLDTVWRVCLVVFAGAYFGYVFRGTLTQSLLERNNQETSGQSQTIRIAFWLNYFSFDECNGNARWGVTDQTRILRLTDGTLESIQFAEICVNDRVALGHYNMTEQTDPVTVYPECITKL